MIYILLSIVLFAINNVLWKKNLDHTSVLFLISFRALFTSLISVLIIVLFYDITTISLSNLYKISLGSLLGAIGLICMLTVVKKTTLQWLGIYNLIGILFTSIYLWFYENYELSNLTFGTLFIIMGFIFFIFNNKSENYAIGFKLHALLLLMTFCFGASALIHWHNLNTEIEPIYIAANQEIIVFILSTIGFFTIEKKSNLQDKYKSNLKNVLLMSLIIFMALLFSFMGIKATNPIISSLLFLSSPILTILFSSIYFKEKITVVNKIAIIIIAIGAFILKLNN